MEEEEGLVGWLDGRTDKRNEREEVIIKEQWINRLWRGQARTRGYHKLVNLTILFPNESLWLASMLILQILTAWYMTSIQNWGVKTSPPFAFLFKSLAETELSFINGSFNSFRNRGDAMMKQMWC